MKTFKASELTRNKMSTKMPKEIEDAGGKVIFKGEIMCWVGIYWVNEGKATPSDYETIPEAIDE